MVGIVVKERNPSEGCEDCSQKTRSTEILSGIHYAVWANGTNEDVRSRIGLRTAVEEAYCFRLLASQRCSWLDWVNLQKALQDPSQVGRK
jgi:hypothetical protein